MKDSACPGVNNRRGVELSSTTHSVTLNLFEGATRQMADGADLLDFLAEFSITGIGYRRSSFESMESEEHPESSIRFVSNWYDLSLSSARRQTRMPIEFSSKRC